jgi:succinate-acetate transporter protein
MVKLGNPAPLGLLAFGLTTSMLMYVDAGWVEHEFEYMIAGYAMFYGGLCQILVAIFELFKGSSFSFAVFGSYGAFWLGWAATVIESHRETSDFHGASYPHGKTAWLITFGILSCCFTIIVCRKNLCLIYTFFVLDITFFLLAAATATGNDRIKKVAGYFGFACALGAWYTGIAELVNEDFGRHVLPGLKPILTPERLQMTKETLAQRISYDHKANTLFLSFRGFQIRSLDDVNVIKESVEEAILNAKAPNDKVHVIVDYNEAFIAEEIFTAYWTMVEKLQEQYYLSASRFHVSSFGSNARDKSNVVIGLKKIADPSIPPTSD